MNRLFQMLATLLVCLIFSGCASSVNTVSAEGTSLPSESVPETLPFDFPLPDGYTTQYKSDQEVCILLDGKIIGGIIRTDLDPSCITDVECGDTNDFLQSLASPPVRVQYFAMTGGQKLYISLTLDNTETGECQEQSHCLFEAESVCFDIWVDATLVDVAQRDSLFETATGQ